MSSCGREAADSLSDPEWPHVLDDQLRLTLVVEDPDIMTPIGIAVNDAGHLYVLESHTHTPPEDYTGPKTDQVKVFHDVDQNGSIDSVAVFAQGINDGMNLIFGPDKHLYVVSSQAVTRFPDNDGDGIHDGAETILELVEPESVYDHAALLGITASPDGWLYVTRGNTGSKAWKLLGTDGSFVEGYGDGGNVIRCRLDGSDVEEVATGFWNPFDLSFSATGRLLVIDNDPDSRGPNRLVDIVQGGDYGYKSLYGGSGIHPFVSWGGELPGTLPYAVGIGEAPSGMLDARHTAFPDEYEHSFLVTIWEESKIVAVNLREEDGVLKGDVKDVVQGGQTFRPVAFAADEEGNVYFTDWVIREYPNHGKGRLWKLSAKSGVEGIDPRPVYSETNPTESLMQRNLLLDASDVSDLPSLEAALLSDNPYAQAAARHALQNPVFRSWLYSSLQDQDARLRAQAALVIEKLNVNDASNLVRKLLTDPEEHVRHVALLWAGREGLQTLLPEIEALFESGLITSALFDTYIATVEQLQPEFIAAYSSKAELLARSIPRALPEGYFVRIMKNKDLPGAIRALALSRAEPEELDVENLKEALYEGNSALQDAAIFSLMHYVRDGGAELLLSFIEDSTMPVQSRADAIMALSAYNVPDVHEHVLRSSWNEGSSKQHILHIEQLRLARAVNKNVDHPDLLSPSESDALKDQVRFVQASETGDMYDYPTDTDAWIVALQEEGDKERGRRVFYSRQAQCSACHVHSGWGGTIGPDLTYVGRSKTQAQIVNAILDPSAEIAPEWQGWYVKTTDGESYYGRQIDVGLQSVELMNLDGTFEKYSNVESHGVAPMSLMPDGLHTQLSLTDMKDLISFLAGP